MQSGPTKSPTGLWELVYLPPCLGHPLQAFRPQQSWTQGRREVGNWWGGATYDFSSLARVSRQPILPRGTLEEFQRLGDL